MEKEKERLIGQMEAVDPLFLAIQNACCKSGQPSAIKTCRDSNYKLSGVYRIAIGGTAILEFDTRLPNDRQVRIIDREAKGTLELSVDRAKEWIESVLIPRLIQPST